ncbi:ABC transporter ATP-binding protein [Ureibacillus aquaedulcis]|uniref:ABC transporter ATP-binding protein n=1 Tax=Ureibacillus aquaedulcis TaxID=3058421 RepID=A0ABT8GT38_9BACL|nr:ABC transporter ATP-binding protein [Ureibacillus sp. BA0131]MDN4494583.1 ABC transporter ATP-binding protein [Ureibacillus sp. BA0131]
MSKLLEICDLKVGFTKNDEFTPVIKGINFSLNKGENLGIVGESGCGKSMTSLAIMGLLKHKGLTVSEGQIKWNGRNLIDQSEKEQKSMLGNEVAMIFQEPMTALNPMLTVGTQIVEQIRAHRKVSKKEAEAHAIQMLKKVGIPSPESRMNVYPHEMSGGMRQRVMIAMAISCEPELLIADEPTTALDVTIQAQILDLLSNLVSETNRSMILITHDLGVVANYCQRVMVMYSGKVMEESPTNELFDKPLHPYTKGLIESVKSIEENSERIASIPGMVPLPGEVIAGCVFCERCPYATDICSQQEPPIETTDDGRRVSCWNYKNLSEVVGAYE